MSFVEGTSFGVVEKANQTHGCLFTRGLPNMDFGFPFGFPVKH